MAGNLSNYAEGKILEHSVGKTSWTMPTIQIALFSTLPTDTTSPTSGVFSGELSGGGYARAANPTWGTVSSTGSASTISNTTAVSFAAATANWSAVVAVGLVDSESPPNLIWWGPLTASKTVLSGETFQFGVGALTLSLD